MTMISGAYANGMLFAASNEKLSGPTATFVLDARNGKIVWRHSSPNVTYGGLAHANGMLRESAAGGGGLTVYGM